MASAMSVTCQSKELWDMLKTIRIKLAASEEN